MEFKGTKGEWKIQPQKDGILKDITCREFSYWFVAQDIGEHDAKLIAAAPELLEALQELLNQDRIKVSIKESGELSIFNDKIEACNKAIKKALT